MTQIEEIPFDQWHQLPQTKKQKKSKSASFVYRPSNYLGPIAIDATLQKVEDDSN